jgi:hypothetical protein
MMNFDELTAEEKTEILWTWFLRESNDTVPSLEFIEQKFPEYVAACMDFPTGSLVKHIPGSFSEHVGFVTKHSLTGKFDIKAVSRHAIYAYQNKPFDSFGSELVLSSGIQPCAMPVSPEHCYLFDGKVWLVEKKDYFGNGKKKKKPAVVTLHELREVVNQSDILRKKQVVLNLDNVEWRWIDEGF